MAQTFHWTIPGTTCRRGGRQPITLHVEATVGPAPDLILTGLYLRAAGPGLTCGERWSSTWAERAVKHLDWIGLSLTQILQTPPPADLFSCACTEISLAPKLWPFLQASRLELIDGKAALGD